VPAGPEGGRRIDRLDGTVTATDLCFRFTHRDPWAVERMSFHVPRGAELAIVGPSGSGKSTLAKLLVGLYPPTSGTVAVDGHDLRTLDLPAVRRLIGVVWQEPQLFSGTIWENLTLRDPGAAPAEVQEAVRLAAIDEEIAAMPLGYPTGLGPSGEGLSGGQRQRLALARALAGQPALLVLDEATSHLDAPAEARIEQNLRSAGITRIVIAHRLSTVQDADLILVVVGGRIVERGTHEDLLARDEVYPAMVRARQSGPGIGVRLDTAPAVLAKEPTDMHLSCVDAETGIAR
jgi:ATP-binding cassette subfamily B protein